MEVSMQLVWKYLGSHLIRLEWKKDSTKAELEDTREEFDIENETLQQQALATDIWKRKFNELADLVACKMDGAAVAAICNWSLADQHGWCLCWFNVKWMYGYFNSLILASMFFSQTYAVIKIYNLFQEESKEASYFIFLTSSVTITSNYMVDQISKY